MKKKFLQLTFIAVSLGMFVSGCSSDNDNFADNSPSDRAQIRLTSGITTHLRSSLQNTQIEAGQKVGFFVTDPTENNNLYENVELTADGAGALSYTVPSKMFYPTNGNNVDFFAYHPYVSTETSLETAQTFAVNADQTVQANYLNSDVLWGTVSSVAKTNNAIPIQFNHKLSKLTFTIKKGEGGSLVGIKNIEILNVLPQTTMNLEDGTLTAAAGTPFTIKAFNVPTTGTSSDTELSGAAAIIIPQTINNASHLFTITIGNVPYKYNTASDVNFESGKTYNYIITVNMAGITVTSNIVDWIDGGSTEGTGEID